MRGVIRGVLLLLGMLAVVPAVAAPSAKPKPAAAEALPPATRGPTSASEVIGRYSVLRSGKDTGCMLTLSANTALLAPACRDNGFVVFDPKGWMLSQRRLMLRARKGHLTTFEMDAAGVWEKLAREPGKPLGLRRM